MAGVRFPVIMDPWLKERIDVAARAAGVSSAEFVRRAVERALDTAGQGGRNDLPDQSHPQEIATSASSPAPAEQPVQAEAELAELEPRSVEEALTGRRPYRQHVPGPNVEGVRSSVQAKRDVQPIPKKS